MSEILVATLWGGNVLTAATAPVENGLFPCGVVRATACILVVRPSRRWQNRPLAPPLSRRARQLPAGKHALVSANRTRGRRHPAPPPGRYATGLLRSRNFHLRPVCHRTAEQIAAADAPLNGLMKRRLIRQLLDKRRREGLLEHFGPIGATAGLLDLLCDFIGQMKRLEIWPDQFDESCRQGGNRQKDSELLEIYQAYQRQLLEHDLYDAEGRFWSARDLLRQQPVRFELVVADGFSDFTRTEHDMLQTLAEHAGETWISLPLEAETGREDLFQKPLRTRDELRKRNPGMREESMARPENPAWPALAHLERTVFSNPRNMKPAAVTARLEIIACGRQIDEIETIGRQIKRLLIDGDVGQISNLPGIRQIENLLHVVAG